MRFLIEVIDSKSRSGTSDEIAAIDEFNEMLQDKGHWIIAVGIDDPAKSIVIDNRFDAGIESFGPVNDTEEYMAGFWLINADSLEQAQELARLGSKACNRKVEVRPLIG
ncbi:MAG: hypothetical protein EBT65_05380 [Actinobacteria bacterium]|nr:hypothetical protein [Actinomycetota bacterium]